MAGQRPTPREVMQGIRRQTLSFTFDPGTAQRWPIYKSTRKHVIERITVSYDTANGSALTGHFAKSVEGAAISTNTDITVTNGVNFNSVANATYVPVFVMTANTSVPSENIINDLDMVLLELNTTAAAGLGLVTVTVETTEIIS